MTTSELMRAMADAGAPFEAILIAIQALDAKDAAIAAKDREQTEKRAKDAERKRQARSERGAFRRRPRNIQGQSKDCPMDPPIEDHTPPVSSNDETSPARKSKTKPPAKPDCVTDATWRDFTDHRKRKGGLTQTALEGIEREAKAAGWPLEAALTEVVTRNWQGFKADWVANAPKPNGAAQSSDPLLAGFLSRQAKQTELAGP